MAKKMENRKKNQTNEAMSQKHMDAVVAATRANVQRKAREQVAEMSAQIEKWERFAQNAPPEFAAEMHKKIAQIKEERSWAEKHV